jgi:dUTP pyrophosphatase
MKIIVEKIVNNARLPTKSHVGDAGWDLYAVGSVTIEPGHRHTHMINIKMQIPSGYCGIIKPRSGWAKKGGIDTLAGVVDSTYRGNIGVMLINHGDVPFSFREGDRIAQMVILPIPTTEICEGKVSNTTRGINGFGSTNLK